MSQAARGGVVEGEVGRGGGQAYRVRYQSELGDLFERALDLSPFYHCVRSFCITSLFRVIVLYRGYLSKGLGVYFRKSGFTPIAVSYCFNVDVRKKSPKFTVVRAYLFTSLLARTIVY